ncbi:hypothetical protein WJX73_005611 [Symbiochloris irregularis]|uniref:Uncharacterized protein n=1 Tax=Symbiochloris irregularis TaxID=706552 RepID=A0AAW1NVZ1_9CHLO
MCTFWQRNVYRPPFAASTASSTSGEANLAHLTVLITGGNAGIGYQTVLYLARHGATVIFTSRSQERGNAAIEAMKQEAAGYHLDVKCIVLDLSNMKNLEPFAARAREALAGRKIDILILNAGIMDVPHQKTEQGHEITFAANHLGHFLLTKKLLPHIARPGRVVVLTAELFLFAKDCTPDWHTSDGSAYYRAKLGNIWFAHELQRREPGLIVPLVHPGVVNTELQQTGVVGNFMKRNLFITPEQGAWTTLYCSLADDAEGHTYYTNYAGILPTNALALLSVCWELLSSCDAHGGLAAALDGQSDGQQAYNLGLGHGAVTTSDLSYHHHAHHPQEDPDTPHLAEGEDDLLTRCKLLEAENRLLRQQVAELPNLKWQVNVLVAALDKLGGGNGSASALLSASASHHVHEHEQHEHEGHLGEDDGRGMEAVMPLQHHQMGAGLQDVGLAHHGSVIPPHLAGAADDRPMPPFLLPQGLGSPMMSPHHHSGGSAAAEHQALQHHQHPQHVHVPHPGIPARDGLCRIPNPPISPTLGKSIQGIWIEHTVGRPPDYPSVEQLIRDHGKKWKLKEYGYNSRVAEKKGVIVKRIKEFIMSGYTPDMAIAALEKEQSNSKMPLSRFIDSIRPGKGKRKVKDAGMGIVEEVVEELASPQFALWASMNGKKYTNSEEAAYRRGVFESNVAYINQENAAGRSHKLAVNAFTDLTAEEFRATHLGVRPGSNATFRARQASTPFSHANAIAPTNKNWVKEGAVTDVKNQLFCGSCWAFSTTGSVEGINYLKTGDLVPLSEQQLVDCDTSKDLGCGGGLMDYAFEYIKKNEGLDTEEDYPYWSLGTICNPLRQDRHVVTIDGFEDVPVNDESALEKAVSQQPVSVAICANDLQFYSSGVVSNCCKDLDHGVLAVGYGEEADGKPYWLVKNSWGGDWGEAGYFKLERGVATKYGTCGITQAASYPVKTHNNPENVPEVCGWLGWSECAAPTSCSCSLSLAGFVCLGWGCQ